MNTMSGGAITSGMERASNFCRYMLPIYESGNVNPLEALETGAANCAVRAFVIGTVIEEVESPAGLFIHRDHGKDLRGDGVHHAGHAVTLYRGSIINTTDSPQAIEIHPIKPDSKMYKEGLVFLGHAAFGLANYVQLNPDIPNVEPKDIIEAQRLIRAML